MAAGFGSSTKLSDSGNCALWPIAELLYLLVREAFAYMPRFDYIWEHKITKYTSQLFHPYLAPGNPTIKGIKKKTDTVLESAGECNFPLLLSLRKRNWT